MTLSAPSEKPLQVKATIHLLSCDLLERLAVVHSPFHRTSCLVTVTLKAITIHFFHHKISFNMVNR
jgi:hypothetical protein